MIIDIKCVASLLNFAPLYLRDKLEYTLTSEDTCTCVELVY